MNRLKIISPQQHLWIPSAFPRIGFQIQFEFQHHRFIGSSFGYLENLLCFTVVTVIDTGGLAVTC